MMRVQSSTIPTRFPTRFTTRSGFTLVELLVAIVVLVVVILATARIFGTASQVTGIGRASASVMQEAAAIEKAIRNDIARISNDGFLAIRQVALRNDFHGPGQPLLNPLLPDDAIIRADQMVFFADGVQAPQSVGIASGELVRGQATTSRVYWGHAGQFPAGQPFQGGATGGQAHDPGPMTLTPVSMRLFELAPWRNSNIQMVRTNFATSAAGTAVYSRANDTVIDGRQPDALQWLLCRQSVILVDDDQTETNSGAKTVYLNEIRSARSIFIDHPGYGFTREIRNGRLDAAATRPDDIRRFVMRNGNNPLRPWNGDPSHGHLGLGDQRSIIASALYYPRAERIAPSMHRMDQALTNNVIGSAVSSFIIEWTWESGTGEVRDSYGNLVFDDSQQSGFELLTGFRRNHDTDNWDSQIEQPWFGLNLPRRGVGFMGFEDAAINDDDGLHYWQRAHFDPPRAVAIANGLANNDNNIERYFPNWFGGGGNWMYEALFGYNRDTPINQLGEAAPELGYTPWPTAIRVTMVLHDPAGKLEHGREFQFVIDLPRRTR